jgi:L-malate glycosyltransferase
MKAVEYVDLIFAHVILPRGLQFVRAKKYYHCPLIVMEHASYYREEMRKQLSQLQRAVIKRTSVHINELLACSEFLQKDMKAIFPTTKSTVLPNFVDARLFYPAESFPQKSSKFLHVSTLDSSVKDPATLLRGVAHAVSNGYNQLELTIVSDQPSEKWQALAQKLGIASHVTFLGPMSWEEIAEQMRAHHAFVLTSSYETFSIVLAEAWLSGLPTITTPVGIGENLDPAFGIQVGIGDAISVAGAMQQLMDGQDVCNREAIRKKGLEYREENIIRQLHTIFERHFDNHD